MAVVPSSECRWDVCEDRDQFLLEDRQVLVRPLSMDFGYRFLSNFVSNVRPHSHCLLECASAFVNLLSNHC
jgi:hypothetical protein